MSDAAALRRPIRVSELASRHVAMTITADEAERAALADAYGLLAVGSFAAELRLKTVRGGAVEVRGTLRAAVVYPCSVTLEPVPGTVEEPVAVRFAPEGGERRGPAAEVEVAVDGGDPPEPIRNGAFDPGPVLAELFALGLDPYPRAPGATFEEPSPPQAEDSPFAVLRPGSGGKGRP